MIFDKSEQNTDRQTEPTAIKVSFKKTMLVANKTRKLPDSETSARTQSLDALAIPDSPDVEVFIMQVYNPRGCRRSLDVVDSVGADLTHGSQP